MKKMLFLTVLVATAGCARMHTREAPDPYESQIDSLIGIMTLEEKIGMIHASSSFTSGGVERLGIPELVMSDGPHGVRFEHGRDWVRDENADDSVTYLPTGICLASTWNTDLGYRFGAVLGNEAKARGKDIILGPAVNIIRTPLNGRNFEYFSEDPFLASRMAVAYINGVQDQGIAACVKHYIANNQEENRFEVNVKMDERTLREIYLPAFRAAVQDAGVLTVMGAFNRFNGQYCSHHEYLVNELLKKEMGFEGLLMSDWAAVHDTREALLYGCDIEMGTDLTMLPDPDFSRFYLADSALAMVRRGEVDESVVDEKIRRILRVMYRIHMFGERSPGAVNTPENQDLALKVAEEGIVLLQNDGILPLDDGRVKRILVVGDNAVRRHAFAGGSSQVCAKYEVTPLEGIRNLAGGLAEVEFCPGYEVTRENTTNEGLILEAAGKAREADAVIFIGGWIHNYDATEWGIDAYDAEGIDKKSTAMLYGQDELIRALVRANANTVVVLMGGGPVDMEAWIQDARAVVQAWYPGMEGGNAIANILFGRANPSGKLPMTFARKLEDNPAHSIGEYPGEGLEVQYKEGIFVGYRYFDSYEVEPRFCFGHGLSYTSFEYSDMKIRKKGDKIIVSCSVSNTGGMDGAETIQVYVRSLDPGTQRPYRELKGFSKEYLSTGESRTVSIELGKKAFEYFDETLHEWRSEKGRYEIQVGNSSREIRLSGEISL